MKNVLLSIVKNEDDIIELFVRYHCKKFDHIFIVNHNSIDRTSDILDKLVQEGLNLTVENCDDPYHIQGKLASKLIKEIRQKYNIQSLIFLDADEFIVGSVENAIKELPNCKYTLGITWFNYVLVEDTQEINVFEKIKYRTSKVNFNQHKTLILGNSLDYNVNFLEGCHELYYDNKPIQLITSKNIHIAHFPIRSYNQFMKKALINWLFKLSNPYNTEKPEWSHWKLFFDIASRNSNISLKELSAGYTFDQTSNDFELIYDPVDFTYNLKYSIYDKDSFFSLFCQTAESLAYQLSLNLSH